MECILLRQKHEHRISAQIVSYPNNLTKGCVNPVRKVLADHTRKPCTVATESSAAASAASACCDDDDTDGCIISMSSIRTVGRRRTSNRSLSICAQVICGCPCERIRYTCKHTHAHTHMRNSGEWLDMSVGLCHKPRAQPVSKFMFKLPRSAGGGGTGLTQQMSIGRAASQRVPRVSTEMV